jgi:hypothetical protein
MKNFGHRSALAKKEQIGRQIWPERGKAKAADRETRLNNKQRDQNQTGWGTGQQRAERAAKSKMGSAQISAKISVRKTGQHTTILKTQSFI